MEANGQPKETPLIAIVRRESDDLELAETLSSEHRFKVHIAGVKPSHGGKAQRVFTRFWHDDNAYVASTWAVLGLLARA